LAWPGRAFISRATGPARLLTSSVTFLLRWQCRMDNSWFTYLGLIAALGLFIRFGSDLVKERRARYDYCRAKVTNPLPRFCGKCGSSLLTRYELPVTQFAACSWRPSQNSIG